MMPRPPRPAAADNWSLRYQENPLGAAGVSSAAAAPHRAPAEDGNAQGMTLPQAETGSITQTKFNVLGAAPPVVPATGLSGPDLKRAALAEGLTFADVRGKSDDDIRARMAAQAAATFNLKVGDKVKLSPTGPTEGCLLHGQVGVLVAPWSLGAVFAWVLMERCAGELHAQERGRRAARTGCKVFLAVICLHLFIMFISGVVAVTLCDLGCCKCEKSFLGCGPFGCGMGPHGRPFTVGGRAVTAAAVESASSDGLRSCELKRA
eukprot:SAG22_NODE_97_length_20760_cov_43.302850_4_plen_263_part_00